MLETLTADSFTPLVGTAFRLSSSAVPAGLDLSLVSATPVGEARRGGKVREHAFSVLFLGSPGAPILPQGIYRLDHDALGSLDLFLVPVGREGDRIQYEAVFN